MYLIRGCGREEWREQQEGQSGRARGEPIEFLDLDWGSTTGTKSPMRSNIGEVDR